MAIASGEKNTDGQGANQRASNLIQAPSISLPKGGGAIHGIGEKFAANPVTGTGAMSIPIATSPGRGGFGPQLSLNYDSGAGNGLFGLGWHLSLPTISRKTDKGLPRYNDAEESDTFILAGAEDMVRLTDADGVRLPVPTITVYGNEYLVCAYRPRVEGLFARIERWTNINDAADIFWRTISRDNITTWYGRTQSSRIFNPDQPQQIFEWFVSEIHDDKGNVSVYEYARESGAGIDVACAAEANRTDAKRSANIYPSRIHYGNATPFLPTLGSDPVAPDTAADLANMQWMFEVVFDYGQCDPDIPAPGDRFDLPVRDDPFSTYRPGFEVRTYRLCRRVLMFHHFEKELGRPDYLVRSTEFGYMQPDTPEDPLVPGYTKLDSVSHWSHQWVNGKYESRQLPPVKFTYSKPLVNSDIQTIAPAQLENLPVGTQGPGYQWIDLDGEGLSGILSEHLGAWYYKPNEGEGQFGPQRLVARQPAMAASTTSRHQFMDLAGDGKIDVVDFSGPTPGFHERDIDEGWKRHVPFASLPNIDWQDANLRFVDLTGDGHADALITEHNVFTWYPSLDERGFGPAERSIQPFDEETGPRLVFADGTQTIFLADMCGDGLTDLVRIRNGEVCYWPNLGYGCFAAKVTLDNSPMFDHPDLYDPRRIRLADIDGSGPIDLIYLGRKGAELYFNRSGNSLSDALTVDLPLATENLAAVQVADLLGNGTACLVWNSHLPADAAHPVRYIDLMAEGKPHLLTLVDNNLGATTEIKYTPSTHFYIADKLAGTPWITRLPFPVHCVSKVTVSDKWRGTKFSSTYSYHHGYFDGNEREFRGFGRVEVLDVERYDKTIANNIDSPWVTDDHTLYQPPVKSVTWYHTGAALDRKRILDQFAHEYFPQRYAARLPDPAHDASAFQEKPLPQPELPAGLDADEWREALRACKGMVLRQETYELDVDDLTNPTTPTHTPVRLFSAATHNCNIQRLQPRRVNKHAVFLVTESEALTYHYELDLHGSAALQPDPRVAHTLNLRHDDIGNPQQSVAIGYARWQTGDFTGLPRPDLIAQVQSELHIAYSEMRYTRDVLLPDPAIRPNEALRHHRLRLPCEVLTYELQGIPKTDRRYYDLADLRACDLSEKYGHGVGETTPPNAIQFKRYHEVADGSARQKRIVEHACTRYFDDTSDTAPPDKHHLLPFGEHGPRGFKYEDYKLALTSELLHVVFESKLLDQVNAGLTAQQMLDDPKISGYIHGADIAPAFTGQYWMRSGTAGFADEAHQHFYLPNEFTDPFDNKTRLTYDNRDLFILSSEDALGNTSGIWLDEATHEPRFDYRVLAPIEMVDANGNRSEVYFDTLGMVVVAAVKGKGSEADDLTGFDYALANPSTAAVQAFATADMMLEQTARDWLGRATTRFVYHFGDVNGEWNRCMAGACGIVRETHKDPASKLQVSLECSDGGGNVLMKKVQAEPDPKLPIADQKLRWIINGLTVLNNKGKPVKQYEPAFSEIGFGCEMPPAEGVTPIIYYDAAGRVVRSEMPDGTFSRVEFSPWHVRTFDANDTILEPGNLWYAEHSAAAASDEDQRAARLAAAHANTPSETHLDSLGREVIAIAHNRTNGVDDKYLTFTKLDAEGKPLWIRDARGNLVMQYITPPKKTRLADENNEEIPFVTIGGTEVYSAPCYDIAGNLLYQHSMDAGDRWMLMDAAGKPMLAWDANDKGEGTPDQRRLFRTDYDALHRPTSQWLKIDAATPALIEAFEYCDTSHPLLPEGQLGLAAAQQRNLIGQAVRHWDPSGTASVERIDLSGKPAHITRRLIRHDADDTTGILDWDVANRENLLESETFHQTTEYDALGRMTRLFNWHLGTGARVAIYEPQYNARGLLYSEELVVRAEKTGAGYNEVAETERTTAIAGLVYNEKGQKLRLALGNGTVTDYTYDARTFRLSRIKTRRPVPARDQCSAAFLDPAVIQDLRYTYDPVGNITQIFDVAQAVVHHGNQRIDPVNRYVYDALYRLVLAEGKENSEPKDAPTHIEGTSLSAACPAPDPAALRKYTQTYRYDSVGNIEKMHHEAGLGTWTRNYAHAFDDPAQSASNRLWQTWSKNDRALSTTYSYDTHGNMLNLANVPDAYRMQWDHRDMIRSINLGGGGTAHYQYDSGKQRTRKRIDNQNGLGGYWERIYLGGYERYRRYNSNSSTPVEEIESHHLFEGEQRVLLVDDVIKTNRMHGINTTYKEKPIYRYQYSNHLGSAALELDNQADIISYEEYHPYGTSAYRLMKSGTEAPTKRYRYTGMERDEESGLSYHTARYYMPWLGRWGSVDPDGVGDDVNLYCYCHNVPITCVDPKGNQGEPWWRFTGAGMQYPTGKHDLLTPGRGYDTGFAPANFVVNFLITATNALTMPVNALTEVAAIPEELARAGGMSETNIASLNFALLMTGVGEVAALPEVGVAISSIKSADAVNLFKGVLGARSEVSNGKALMNIASAQTMKEIAAYRSLKSAYRQVAAKELGNATPMFTKIGGFRMKSWAEEVLVGTSQSQFRENAKRIIESDPKHPLRVLLDKNGKFFSSTEKGMDLVDLMFDPKLVQAGHLYSNFAIKSDMQMIVFQSAYENQFFAQTAESGLQAMQISDRIVVNVGGIGLSENLARDLSMAFPELKPIIDTAKRISF